MTITKIVQNRGWRVVEEEVVHFRVEGGACKEEEVGWNYPEEFGRSL